MQHLPVVTFLDRKNKGHNLVGAGGVTPLTRLLRSHPLPAAAWRGKQGRRDLPIQCNPPHPHTSDTVLSRSVHAIQRQH